MLPDEGLQILTIAVTEGVLRFLGRGEENLDVNTLQRERSNATILAADPRLLLLDRHVLIHRNPEHRDPIANFAPGDAEDLGGAGLVAFGLL